MYKCVSHEPIGKGARPCQKATPVAACASPRISSRRQPASRTVVSATGSVAGSAASHCSAAAQMSHPCPWSLPSAPPLPPPPSWLPEPSLPLSPSAVATGGPTGHHDGNDGDGGSGGDSADTIDHEESGEALWAGPARGRANGGVPGSAAAAAAAMSAAAAAADAAAANVAAAAAPASEGVSVVRGVPAATGRRLDGGRGLATRPPPRGTRCGGGGDGREVAAGGVGGDAAVAVAVGAAAATIPSHGMASRRGCQHDRDGSAGTGCWRDDAPQGVAIGLAVRGCGRGAPPPANVVRLDDGERAPTSTADRGAAAAGMPPVTGTAMGG